MYFAIFWTFCLFFRLVLTNDPCFEAVDISDKRRSYSYQASFDDTPICDIDLDLTKWYSFGGNLTRHCVKLEFCGTYSTVWVKGKHPTGDEIVTAEICSSDLQGNCCAWKSEIQIKKCGSSFVYKLAKVDECPKAYCVGDDPAISACNDDQVSVEDLQGKQCLDIPTIDLPKLGKPYVSAWKNIFIENTMLNATVFSLDCGLDTKQDVSKYLLQGKLMIEAVFKMDGVVVSSYLHEFPIDKFSMNESSIAGHLGKMLSCSFRLYYDLQSGISSTKTDWRKSETYFMGFVAKDVNDNIITNLVISQAKKETIRLVPTFPITLGHCFENKNCDPLEYVFDFAPSSSRILTTECQVIFTSNRGEPVSSYINISSKISFGIESSGAYIRFHKYNHPTSKTLFDNYVIAPIKVTTEEHKQRPQCRTVSDPHYSSFHNMRLSNFLIGDFNFVTGVNRSLEIQVRQIQCGRGGGTCICGIIAREGNNMLGISACDYQPSARVFELMGDNVNPKAKIDKEGSSYLMQLPSGFVIKVDTYFFQRGTFLNVFAFGLKHEQYEGFCAAARHPVNLESFRIKEKQSFFQSRLPSCVSEIFDDPLCVCCQRPSERPAVRNNQSKCCLNSMESSVRTISLQNVCDLSGYLTRAQQGATTVELKIIDGGFARGGEGLTINDLFGSVDHSRDFDNRTIEVIDDLAAKEKCTEVFKRSPVYDSCKAFLKEDFVALETSCVTDVQLTGELEYATVYIGIFERLCKQVVDMNISIKDGERFSEDVKLTEISDKLGTIICPTCLNGGQCDNGNCLCRSGYGGVDCFHNVGLQPSIQFFQGNSFCDISSRRCYVIQLEYHNIVAKYGVSVLVKVVFKNEDDTEWYTTDAKGTFTENNFLQIHLDEEAFRVSSSQKNVFYMALQVVAAEDKEIVHADSNKLILTVFNGVCMHCSPDGCAQKNDSCLIDNVCYKAMHVFNDQFICDPVISRDSWSRKGDGGSKSKSFPWILIIICIIIIAVTIITITVVCWCVVRRSRRGHLRIDSQPMK